MPGSPASRAEEGAWRSALVPGAVWLWVGIFPAVMVGRRSRRSGEAAGRWPR